jgi:lipid A 3-O-deacylase
MNKLFVLLILFNFSSAFAADLNLEKQNSETQKEDLKSKPQPEKSGAAFGFSVENDARVLGGPGSDQAYSNGFKVSYSYNEDHVPAWAESTVAKNSYFKSKINETKVNFGISLAQQLYTPADTGASQFIPDDRRYAAWTYFGFSSQVKTEYRADLIELDLGMVGPSAFGEQVQNNFHRLIKTSTAEGWANQLSDEPTIQLSYQQKFRFFEMEDKNGKYFDAIPYFGAGLGNVHIGAHIGGLIRFGINIPDDFGPSRLSASDGESFVSEKSASPKLLKNVYAFAGARGNAIAHDIFLDGNTFRSNRTVSKIPFVLETELGFGTQLDRWILVWRFVTRTPEFEEKQKYNSFASINILYLM